MNDMLPPVLIEIDKINEVLKQLLFSYDSKLSEYEKAKEYLLKKNMQTRLNKINTRCTILNRDRASVINHISALTSIQQNLMKIKDEHY